MFMFTLKEEVDDEDRSKGYEEVWCDDGDNKEGARDHGDAVQEGPELLRDLRVDDVNVGGESVEDPADRSCLEEGERSVHCLLKQSFVDLLRRSCASKRCPNCAQHTRHCSEETKQAETKVTFQNLLHGVHELILSQMNL